MTDTKTKPTMPFDPFALARTATDYAWGLAAKPAELLEVQMDAARQWSSFWTGALTGTAARSRATAASARPNGRTIPITARSAIPICWRRTSFATLVSKGSGDEQSSATARFLLDQYLNAVSPTNFAHTNPAVIKRVQETGGQNLVQGFANLLEDISTGKGIVRRRTDPDVFVKGKTIAATPGEVVFQNDLFQLIQYSPATDTVAAEPLLYVPPLVNRFYMIDLQPRSSLIKWLVDQGRTVFVVSWVNPGDEHRDKDVAAYVLEGIVPAIEQVRKRTGHSPDLFAFCLGGTLVAIALAWLAAKKRGKEVNSATLIGSMIDFADMRDWSAFVHETHIGALDDHLEKQGYADSAELQRLFAAMRANDLIWSSVVQHYLLDQPAPPSDLLTWFEDGARIPAAFLKSYNRDLLLNNSLKEPAGFKVGGRRDRPRRDQNADPVDRAQGRPCLGLGSGLRRRAPARRRLRPRRIGPQCRRDQPARRQQAWLLDQRIDARERRSDWLESATKHEGSWWPHWTQWLDRHGSERPVAARAIKDGIEPAPGSYVMMP